MIYVRVRGQSSEFRLRVEVWTWVDCGTPQPSPVDYLVVSELILLRVLGTLSLVVSFACLARR